MAKIGPAFWQPVNISFLADNNNETFVGNYLNFVGASGKGGLPEAVSFFGGIYKQF